jgi:tetratricopeptide (TPR) repeat protein
MQLSRNAFAIALFFAAVLVTALAPASAAPDEASYDRAYKLMQANRYEQAIPLFERYIASVPASDFYDLEAAHLNAGECYYQTDNYAGAARHFDAAIMLYPSVRREKGANAAYIPAIAYFDDGFAHLQLEQYREAADYATRGFSADPDVRISDQLAFGYRTRGLARYYLREYGPALADLNAALKVEPNSYSAHLVRGQILRATHDYQGSLREFIAANKLHHNEGTPYCEAALTLALQRRDALAKRTLSICYSLDKSLRPQYDAQMRELLSQRR